MQHQRRHNPYPTTWEIPAGLAVLALVGLAWGVHVGRGLATWAAGHGWTWPTYLTMATSIPAILTGDADAGLPADTLPAGATIPVIGWVIGVEALYLLLVVVGSVWGWARWGGGRMLGMATGSQAAHVLGIGRLRAVRHVIRPDLYPKKRAMR